MFALNRVVLSKLRCGVALSSRNSVRYSSSRPSPRPRAPEQKSSNNNKSYAQQSLERIQNARKTTGGSAAASHEALENNSQFNSTANKELNDLRKEFIKRAETDPAIQKRRKNVGSADPKNDE
eukprot:TRINITY_DN4192_c0_g1_i1.p1 TRINITY_DN4192_c0_g1~~TRINITY_DN4192_c0_g1_i1.p1  ORF type:complete len:123 (-),score=19.17 TRINITY_DN4192_c0_g1_i1:145-513(-)